MRPHHFTHASQLVVAVMLLLLLCVCVCVCVYFGRHFVLLVVFVILFVFVLFFVFDGFVWLFIYLFDF